jgi:diamine N-acetyltransferase
VQFYASWGAYAVYHGKEMIGFAMYEHDQEEGQWWISNLMIAAEHQGRGYGRLATEVLIALMVMEGCKEILVGYADDNEVARRLYQRLGFVEQGLDEEGDMVSRFTV